jgi:cysteine desulfurase/selenocysteine lyase
MITADNYGLPSEKELEAWAGAYFPELKESNTAYAPVVVPGTNVSNSNFDVNRIRADFPILGERLSNGKQLIWLDNGATTQKPRQVIDRITYFYEHENSNVHRGAHELAARSTDAYEAARETIARFLGTPSRDNIVFVRGTTEGINLVAHSYVKPLLSPGDEIVLTILEHHANIVPWQLIAQETGAVIKVAPVDSTGQIIVSEYERLFGPRTKFASVTHVSNALGTITPVHELVQIAHRHGVRILIDGAQSVAHTPVNVSELDADFFVFSGHKIFAPTGIGVLYGKADALKEAQPYQGGGNMIKDVTFERTVYNSAPTKFEAGTGNIADAIGLGAALDYVTKVGLPNISVYEHELLNYATRELSRINGLRLIGTAREKASTLSFVLDGYSTDQVGKHLSSHGIAARTGHHCAQPILRHFGLESTVRSTIAFYNTADEIDALVRAIREIAK